MSFKLTKKFQEGIMIDNICVFSMDGQIKKELFHGTLVFDVRRAPTGSVVFKLSNMKEAVDYVSTRNKSFAKKTPALEKKVKEWNSFDKKISELIKTRNKILKGVKTL
jgi:hypothetical protein